MPFIRRARGVVLRLVRHRSRSIVVGIVLVVPAAFVEFSAHDIPWWLRGTSLVAGATGLALIVTGLTGTSPDWIE